MSIWPHWASQVFSSARAPRRGCRRELAGTFRLRRAFETLENRRLLTVGSNFLTGTLSIALTAADNVAISTAGGNVKLAINGIGGFDPDSGSLFAGGVTNIVITGTGNFSNTVDLTGINKSDFSTLLNIALDAGGGSDTYKLDQSILPAAAVISIADTGLAGSGSDALQLSSTSVGPETIGISQTSVTRSGGPTVSYSGIESLQVSGTGGADTIDIANTGANTFTAVNAGGGLDSFGAIDLTQIGAAGLIVNAGSNGESLTLGATTAGTVTLSSNLVQRSGNGPVAFSGVSALAVNGSSGLDTFQVNSTAPGAVTLDGQAGADIYSIVQSALGGAITVSDSGASGVDQISSTSQAVAGETIGITNTQITRSGSPAINYSGIENLAVNGTVGVDTFNVTTTPSGATTLDGGASGDFYNITQSALGGTLSISDSGPAGSDQLTSTSLAAGGETIGISSAQITRSGSQTISYSGIENLAISGTAGADTFNVGSTPSGSTVLDGQNSGDIYNVVQSALSGLFATNDSGASGTDVIGSTSTASGESIGVFDNQITRSASVTIGYTGIENLNISGTSAIDAFTVASTPSGTTTLDGLDSADGYNISQSGLGGTLGVNDSGATGIDQLTSTSALPGGETIDITNAKIARTGEQTILYTGIENLTVGGTSGADTLNVSTTPIGTTLLDGLANGDTYNIIQNALGGPLLINDSGASGTDLISSTSLAAGGENIGISSSEVTRSGSQDIDYSGIENLAVTGTAGIDTFTITSTPNGTATVDGQNAGDTYNVTQSSLGGTLSVNDSGATSIDQLISTTAFSSGETIDITNAKIGRSGEETVNYAGIENLTVGGNLGADIFNVASTPAGSTLLDGQASGDSYNIVQSALGGPISISDTGGSGTDLISSTSLAAGGENIGISSSQITRSGSQSIGYSGIEDVTVRGTAGADTFTITSTPGGSTMLDGLASDDSYDVTQSALGGLFFINDTGASGGDLLTSTSTASGEIIGITSVQITRSGSQTISYGGIESLIVGGTSAADTFNVSTTPSGTTMLDGQAGDDTYNITQSALGGLLAISDSGAGGIDVLNSISLNGGGESIGITNAQITRSGSQTVGYSGIENLNVNGTAGSDTFTVTTTPSGTTALDGQNSDDTYNITQSALGGPLAISDTGANGTDRLTSVIGSALGETIGVSSTQVARSAESTISYSGIENLTVVGTAAADTFQVASTAAATVTTINADPLPTDAANDMFVPIDLTTIGAAGLTISTGGDGEGLTLNSIATGTVSISNSTVQRSGNGAINYLGIASLIVNGTGGADTFNIVSTAVTTLTTVNAGAANDFITVGNAGSLAGILGALSIHGEGNDISPSSSLTSGATTNTLPVGDTLHFDDSATAAASNYTLNSGSFLRTAIAAVNFDGAETVVLDAGTSSDLIGVSSTLPGINVKVNGNNGADTINLTNNGNGSNVTLSGGADGDTLNIRAVAVNSIVLAGGGAGNDTVNVSTDAPNNVGTLDSVVGNLSIDTGGESDKIVLSDQGQAAVANSNVMVRSDRVDGFAGPTNAVSIRYAFAGSLELSLVGSQKLADKFHVALSAYPAAIPLTLKFDGLGQPSGGMDGLRIDGTGSDDVIRVGASDPIQIQNIECLQIFGAVGNDFLENDTGVSSLIDGGDGNDTLVGGGAVDVIFGGDGVDTIYGRGGGDYLFADHEFNNRAPRVKHSVAGDKVYGDKSPYANDPLSNNPGIDTIVIIGIDSVDAGGQVGDTIVGSANGLTVLDWLRARFLTANSKNIQDAINKALAQPCTMLF